MVTIRFTQSDYKRLVEDAPDYPFYGKGAGGKFNIFDEDTEKKVGFWNSKTQKLTIGGTKANKWLKENSYL